MTHVAVLVPGIMGSVLKRGDEVIWPGPVSSLLLPYDKMEQLLDPDLKATDCIRSYFITEQYQKLIDDLEECGFRESEKTLVVAAYDWRKSIEQSVETLAAHLDQAVANHGQDLEIFLVAHSMGGLVSRYYLESGRFQGRPGFAKVRRLITLATPHRGAAVALSVVLGKEKRLFLNKEQVHQVCSDKRYPGAYQLLPPRGEPVAWDPSTLEPIDVYEPSTASALGLAPESLDAAERFHRQLDVARRPEHVRYFCFSGTRQTTASHAQIQPRQHGLDVAKVEHEDAGDGTVPTWSSFLPPFQRMFVGGDHSTIYKNRDLRRTLATLLGRPARLRAVPAEVEVSLRDKVVEPDRMVHVAVLFGQGAQDFSGVLTIERVTNVDAVATGVAASFAAPRRVHPITYKGLGLQSMSLVFQAPDAPGVYRVAFRDAEEAPPAGYDELIVQSQ